MNDSLKNKLSSILGKVDDKVLEARLNAALDMLKNGNTEELVKKINSIDKNELAKKLNELDESKLKDLNLNLDEVKQKVSPSDLDKLSKMAGENGDEIMKKFKELLGKV